MPTNIARDTDGSRTTPPRFHQRRQLLRFAAGVPLLGLTEPPEPDAQLQARVAIDAHTAIGESPVWDERRHRLLWIDQATGSIFEARSRGWRGWYQTRRWELQRPIAALILRRSGGFLVVAADELLSFDENSGETQPWGDLKVAPGTRLNEAKCDPQGRLWATTLAEDFSAATGVILRIDPSGYALPVYHGVRVGNGMDWSRDGNTFFFIDSLAQTVSAFDFDAGSGDISNRRDVVSFEQCAPDGMTVDSEGCLWVAAAAAGEVRRYTRIGQLITRVKIGTPGVTNCTFGGRDLRSLLITSLNVRMPEIPELGIPSSQLENSGPEAGAVFVCQPGVTGIATRRFAG